MQVSADEVVVISRHLRCRPARDVALDGKNASHRAVTTASDFGARHGARRSLPSNFPATFRRIHCAALDFGGIITRTVISRSDFTTPGELMAR